MNLFINNKISIVIFTVLLTQTVYSQDYRSNSRRHRLETPDTTAIPEGSVNSRTLYGSVRSLENEILALASVTELGTKNIVYTNDQGVFFIKLNLTNKKVKLIGAYNGFENDTILVDENTSLINFNLKLKYEVIREVVISASRKRELKFESSASIETLDPKQLLYNPGVNANDRISNLAGVDIITTSLNFKVVNTRGFNAAYNRRFIQRFDNMELGLPGFSTALVQLNGPIDLDIEKTELVSGAAGAIYGPNALNGLTNTTSKNPFQYKGLSVNLKTGMNHVDNVDEKLSPYYDLSLRYANTINKKLAYKVVMSYMKGTDWHAKDYSDISDYSTSKNNTYYGYTPGAKNPGYDGINMGGDEEYKIFDSKSHIIGSPPGNSTFNLKQPLKIARTGFRESDVFNYDIYSFKTDAGLYYRPNKNTEISWTSRIGAGNSNFQTENRTQVQNFIIQMHKFEVKNKNQTFRSYISAENSGTSYDFNTSAIKVNQSTKNDENWYEQYLFAYTGQYNNMNTAKNLGLPSIASGDDAAARKFADGDNSYLSAKMNFPGRENDLFQGKARLVPGTAAFDSAWKSVTSHDDSSGSQLYSRSKIWYSEYIYDFKDVIKSFSLMAGTNYRLYAPLTQGSILTDKNQKIYSNELGGFVQAGKDFREKRIKLQASLRVDKMQRFDVCFSPRVSSVFQLGKRRQHNIRVSAQIGNKMPSLYDQFNNIFVPRLRNFGAFYQTAVDMGLIKTQANGSDVVNMYTQSSVNNYLNNGDSSQLVKPVILDLKPEQVRAFEIGWRAFTYKKLETDMVVYYNRYQNMITSQQYIGPGQPQTQMINASLLTNPDPRSTTIYRRSVNSAVPVNTYGTTLSANYYYSKKITLFGNYSYNTIFKNAAYETQGFIVDFNTPKNKFNVGINGIKLWNKVGFSAIYRWVQSYDYEEYTKKGIVPSYYTLDLAFTYHLDKKYNTMLKIGGSNVTNVRYVQSIGGPTIGALFYFSILYDDLLK